MDTDTVNPQTENKPFFQIENKADVEYVIPYFIRAQFRDILMGFFNQSDKKLGAYVTAEEKAKQYFLTAYAIPVDAWNYRNRAEAARKKNKVK